MLDISTASLTNVACAWVGNKSRYEGVRTYPKAPRPDDLVTEILLTTILKPFQKVENYYYLSESEGAGNAVKDTIDLLFHNVDAEIDEATSRLAALLYDQMDHPRPSGGDFFVCYFRDLIFNDEPVNAVALWKVNSYNNFLQVKASPGAVLTTASQGIDTSKVELCALVLNMEADEGYRVLAIDTVTRSGERSFWKDGLLHLRPIEDEYYQTRHYMTLTDDFIRTKTMKYSLTKPEKIALLNRAADYFRYNDEFEINDFFKQVFEENDEMVEGINDFIREYGSAYSIHLEERFDISNAARKAFLKIFKTTVKLDKNFRLDVTTSRKDLVERGFDEDSGKKYYKVSFDDEQ